MKKFFKILGLTITSILALFIIVGIIAVKTAPDTKKEVVQAKEFTSAVATPAPTKAPIDWEAITKDAIARDIKENGTGAYEIKQMSVIDDGKTVIIKVKDSTRNWKNLALTTGYAFAFTGTVLYENGMNKVYVEVQNMQNKSIASGFVDLRALNTVGGN